MKNIITLAIALAILVVFPSMSWAQEEGEPQSMSPERIEAATTNRIEQNQIEKTRQLQQKGGMQNQAVTVDAAASEIDGCKVQSINVLGRERVDVESNCSSSGVPAFRRVLSDKDNDGVVDIYDEGAGPIEFKTIDVRKKTAAGEQYDFAMQRFARTLQAVAIARNGKAFRASEKCNRFTTEQGIEYEVFAKVGLGDKKQPIILGYKIKQTKDGDTITVDVSMDSLYKTAFAGIVPAIHANGCPLSEWVIFPDGIKSD